MLECTRDILWRSWVPAAVGRLRLSAASPITSDYIRLYHNVMLSSYHSFHITTFGLLRLFWFFYSILQTKNKKKYYFHLQEGL